jgi:hypothetical protein
VRGLSQLAPWAGRGWAPYVQQVSAANPPSGMGDACTVAVRLGGDYCPMAAFPVGLEGPHSITRAGIARVWS